MGGELTKLAREQRRGPRGCRLRRGREVSWSWRCRVEMRRMNFLLRPKNYCPSEARSARRASSPVRLRREERRSVQGNEVSLGTGRPNSNGLDIVVDVGVVGVLRDLSRSGGGSNRRSSNVNRSGGTSCRADKLESVSHHPSYTPAAICSPCSSRTAPAALSRSSSCYARLRADP